MSFRRSARLVIAGLLLSLTTACGYHGLSFVKDERVEITAPLDRAKVKLPVVVRWTIRDFEEGGSFGVFLDRAPQPPGETFEWFAEGDNQCEVTPGCPDLTYFASKNAYRTTRTEFTIERLPETRREDARRFRDMHEVVVALLDADGRRIGESAFSVEFELDRSES